MTDRERYKEDIQAVREAVNIYNMMMEHPIVKVVSAGNLNITDNIGVFRTNLYNYSYGLVQILVNRNSHEVYGFYSKVHEIPNEGVIVCVKIDVATEILILEVIDIEGNLIKSLKTDKNMNTYCEIYDRVVKLDKETYELN